MALTTRNLIEILISARDEASRQLDKVGTSAAALDKKLVLVSASMAAAGAAIITAVSAAAISGARYADTIDAIAERTQVSRETITALGVTLAKTGGSFEDSEVAVRAFNQALVDAVSGQKLAVAQFQRLGIGVDELVGPNGKLRSFEELLPRVADGFQKLGDEALATDSAVALFGRGATAFIPVLSKGSSGLSEMRKEAEAFSATLRGPMQEQAIQFGNSIGENQIAVTGLKNALAGALNPTLGETVRNFTAATKAAAEFTQQHPQLVSNVFATVTALTALSAAPAVFKGLATATRFLQLELIGGSAAAAVFGKSLGPLFVMARTATGQFAGLTATTLGVAAGIGVLTASIGGLVTLIGLQIKRHAEIAAAQRAEIASEAAHTDQIKRETGSIEEQLRALDRLRTERGNLAARKVSAVGVFDADLLLKMRNDAFDRAVEQFDKQMAGVRDRLIKHAVDREGVVIAGVQIKPRIALGDVITNVDPAAIQEKVRAWFNAIMTPAIEQVGPTLEAAKLHPKIDIEVAPIDPRDFASQIARQQEVLNRAIDETTLARTAVVNAGNDPVALVAPSERLTAALKTEAEARQRVFDLKRQAIDADRDLIRQTRDNEAALLALAQASGKITLDEAFTRSLAAAEKYKSELEQANAAVARATPGTVEYSRAVERQTEAIRALTGAQSSLDAAIQASAAKQQAQIERSNALTEATRQLAIAKEQLAIAEGKGSVKDKQAAIDAAELARLKQKAAEAQAQIQGQLAAQAAGLPVFGPSAEQIANAANAVQIYSNAILQAQEQTDKLSAAQTVSQGLGGVLTSVFTSAGQGAAQMARSIGHAIASIIADLLRAILVAKLFRALVGGAAGPVGALSAGFTPGLPIPGRQSGGRVASGVRGRDTELVRVGKDETIFTHDLSDQLASFLAVQKKSDALGSHFASGVRSDVRVIERVTRESSPSNGLLARLASALERRNEREPRAEQPVVHLKQETHLHAGVLLGTEIESNRLGQEVNERSRRFSRQFIAAPGFTG